MPWFVFSYSLSSRASSSQRVALWRRLKRLGALPHKSGVYVLPDREDCQESFQWLVQEVQEAHGNAGLMKVERFEGLTDNNLSQMFRESAASAYKSIDYSLDILEKNLKKKKLMESATTKLRTQLEKLKNQFDEIKQIDFFDSSKSVEVLNRFNKIQQLIFQPSTEYKGLPSYKVEDYKSKKWVTRPRPHVDRLACVWLIRKFIDPKAAIRYSNTPNRDELPFDFKDAIFGHHGNLVSFETMIKIFALKDPVLKPMAEIVHEIDLRDKIYFRPETEGVAMILKGWLKAGFPDEKLESQGIVLFEGLYKALS